MTSFFYRSYGWFLAILACSSLVVSSCSSPTRGELEPLSTIADATPVASNLAPVTDLIEDSVRRARLEGASLLVIQDEQVVYQQSFGDYSLDTVVPIASATKWISASVIMSLVDEGLLNLDAPISTYLANFTGDKGDITLRQLLSHTSGLPSTNRCMSQYRGITLAACVDQIAQMPLAAKPGTEFRYGGASFQVAGRIAEVVSGKSWSTLFEERIREPLMMEDTTYGDVENPRIGGGAYSSLSDYRNLLLMHLQGGTFQGRRVLSEAAVAEMQRNQIVDIPVVRSPLKAAAGYGLGVWIDLMDAQGNAVQLSSQGAFGFSPWIDVERNLLGVFLVRDRLGQVAPTVEAIQQFLRQEYDANRLPQPTAEVKSLTPTPTFQWAQGLGGVEQQVARGVTADASGDVWVTGSFASEMVFPGTAAAISSGGGQDFF